ncbi:MAG: transcriptional regulator NrdR [Candidatus Latescibacteria bacterium]|nr:transcriptional regulator NrdR [Candidatus Latescibacterota bacterium]
MKCPFCNKEEDRVLDSRVIRDGLAVRRRRECLSCKKRFTTYEYVERSPLMIIKNDGQREEYDRDKLIAGITLAAKKRPVSRTTIEKIVSEIENEIADEYKLEIESKELGERVLAKLIDIDQVAYVRFASVYHAFQNINEFAEAMQGIDEIKRTALNKEKTK